MLTEAEIYQLLIDYQVRTAEAERAMAQMQAVTQQTTHAMGGLAPAAGQAASWPNWARSPWASWTSLNLANAFWASHPLAVHHPPPDDRAWAGALPRRDPRQYRKLAATVGDAGDTMLAVRAVTHGVVDDRALMQPPCG